MTSYATALITAGSSYGNRRGGRMTEAIITTKDYSSDGAVDGDINV